MKEVRIALQKTEQINKQIFARRIMYDEFVVKEGKEEHSLTDYEFTAISREQLYNEIWTISAYKVAKKYNVSFASLKKACETANIPMPSKSYWGNLSMGKETQKEPLLPSDISEVKLPHIRKKQKEITNVKKASKKQVLLDETDNKIKTHTLQSEHTHIAGEQNIYDREELYREVWENPVTTVAKKYGVSDVMIHKICKSLEVPTPPRGYWAKGNDRQVIEKIPLPPVGDKTIRIGKRTYGDLQTVKPTQEQTLEFLSEEERLGVLSASQRIEVIDDNKKLHKKLIEHDNLIRAWRKKYTVDPLASRKYDSYSRTRPDAPFLWCEIADESFSRVYRMLNVLFNYIEKLGGQVNDDLSFQIRNERITYKITEAQSKVPHVLTKSEQKALEEYDRDKLKYSYVTKPQIRKWDYISNGKLRFLVLDNKCYKDTENSGIEERLGEILIDLFEKSEKVRIAREEKEEAQRKAEEEHKARELERQRYNEEVDRTLALENEAEDYSIACKIRAYVTALESKNELTEKDLEWIAWAKDKADWYDPTVNGVDRYFGVREHKEDAQNKKPKKSYYGWHN